MTFTISLWAQASVKPAQHSSRGPLIHIERQVVDVGLVKQGKEIRAEFQMKNSGVQDLLISELQPSCGCILVSFDRILKPGESGAIKVSIDHRRLNGVFEKEVGFVSNDPSHPKVKLTVKGKFEPTVSVKPSPFVHIDVVSKGESQKRTLILASADPKFTPELAETNEPFVRASLASSESAHTLLIEIAPDAPLGVINSSVIVRTGLEAEPELEIPVSAFVVPKTVERPRRSLRK